MTSPGHPFPLDVAVVGGCGHVGLPLALALAGRGLSVTSYDIDDGAVETVMSGAMPFAEPGGDEMLRKVLASGRFRATSDPAVISTAETLVVVIGTPVDEHQNPDPDAVRRAISGLSAHLRDHQLLVLRSTVYPGVTRLVDGFVSSLGKRIDVAFCPERIAEGKAFTELYELPQLVAGCNQAAMDRASKLFGVLTGEIVEVEPEEAELAKLFTNSWRYIKFAAANQFFMIANNYGLDYERVRAAVTFNYPRAADLPGAGFAAGPCLFKDTAQISAFNTNNFPLGNASVLVNEGLPIYLVDRLATQHDLSRMSVGVLGMAFKAESDDTRSSLAYKLRRILRFKASEVLCTDPYVTTDLSLLPLDEVLQRADLLVIAAPHRVYRDISTEKPIVDIWNLFGRGVRVTPPRVSVVIPAYNEGENIIPVLDRIFEAVTLPAEVLVVIDAPSDTTRPVLERYAEHEPRLSPVLNTVGRGPANAIRVGIDRSSAPVVVVTMADGCDDPMQIDSLARLVERGVVVAAASCYMRGGQQVGGPWLKGTLSRLAGRSLYHLARVGTHDATNSFKAYSAQFVRNVGIESDRGFEIGIELVAKARRSRQAVAEIPTIWLDRSFGVSNFQMRAWLSRYLRWYVYAFGRSDGIREPQQPDLGSDHKDNQIPNE